MASGSDVLEEGGDGYFASVSDLMVGILFVFLLMLTVFALNFRDAEDVQNVKRAEYERLEQALEFKKREAELLKAEADADKVKADIARKEAEALRLQSEERGRLLAEAAAQLSQDIKDRQLARHRLLFTLRERLSKAGIIVEVDPETGVLRLPEQLLFDKGQSALGMTAGPSGVRLDPVRMADVQDKLTKLGNALADVLPCFGGSGGETCPEGDRSTLEGALIEGHSDRLTWAGLTSEGSRERNDLLSVQRALAVFKEVRTRNGLGDLRNRQGLPMLAVSAYGDRRPIASGATDEELKLNRRIDLRFLLSTQTSDKLQTLLDRINLMVGRDGPRGP